MTVTVYRSDDVGAPLLTGTLGSLNSMLKAVLVDGYGTKAGSGWTMPYDDISSNGQSIFANASGKHFLVQHDEWRYTNGTTTSNYHYAYIRGCSSYTDWSTTTGNFPQIIGDTNPDLSAANQQMLLWQICQVNAFNSGVTWTVIADDKTIYIMLRINNYAGDLDPDLNVYTLNIGYNKMSSFGDYGLLGDDVNPYNSYVAGYSGTSTTSSSYTSMAYESYAFGGVATTVAGWMERNSAGDVGCVEFATYPENPKYTNYVGGAYITKLNPFIGHTEYYIGMSADNKYSMSRILLYATILATENIETLQYADSMAGYYRGLYILYNNTNPNSAKGANIRSGDTVSIEGRSYYVIVSKASNNGSDMNYLFDITGWD